MDWLDRVVKAPKKNDPKLYIKKPIPIQALQLRWDTWCEMCDFIGVNPNGPRGTFLDKEGKPTEDSTDVIGLTIPTLEGVMLARQGDYIVKGVEGEIYSVKQSIFEKTYEELK
jgi:hypothetical protein